MCQSNSQSLLPMNSEDPPGDSVDQDLSVLARRTSEARPELAFANTCSQP